MNKVCIIGSGIAGISAAEFLIRNNIKVDIYEAAPNIGGRITSIFDTKTNEYIDNGQHLLVGAYTRFLELLKTFGTTNLLKFHNGLKLDFFDEKQNQFRFDLTRLPGIFGQLLGIFNFKALTLKEQADLILFALKIKTKNIRTNKSCYDFLVSNKQSEQSVKYFWEPLILATINNNIYEAPAQLLINVLKDAFFKDKISSSLIFPKSDLNKLIQPFQKFLSDNNSKLFLKSKINKIVIDNNICKGIELKSGEFKAYDLIISTIPPYALEKIIPENISDFSYLKEFMYSPIMSAYLWYDKNPLNQDIYALIGTKSQWIFNKRNFSSNNSEIQCLLSITISNALEFKNSSPKEIVSVIDNEIKNIIPEFSSANLLHSRIIKENMATFKADLKTEKIRPENKTNISGLFLAGDWTNTGYPATIEGAARSGYEAAKNVLV